MKRVRLPKEVIAPLRGTCGAHGVAAIALDLTLIAAAIVGSQWWGHPLGYVGAVVLIGARQHALLVLMHEATHGVLFRNRRLNEAVGAVLAWPMLASLQTYRTNHVAHHAHLNSARDPDWARYFDPESPLNGRWRTPAPGHVLALRLLRDLSGLGFVDQVRRVRAFGGSKGRSTPARWVFYGAIVAAVTLLGIWPWFALYWLLPMVTWLPFALRLRLWAEHNLPGGMGTRTVRTGLLGRLLIAPHGINFHTEHHLFANVPFHRLHRLHAALVEAGAFEDPSRRVTHGYLRVFAELCAAPEGVRREA